MVTSDGKLNCSNNNINAIKNTVYYISGIDGSFTVDEHIRNGSHNYPFATIEEAKNYGIDTDSARLYISGNGYSDFDKYKRDYQFISDNLVLTDTSQVHTVNFRIIKKNDSGIETININTLSNSSFKLFLDEFPLITSNTLSLTIPANSLQENHEYTIKLEAKIDNRSFLHSFPFLVLQDYQVTDESSFTQLKNWIDSGLGLNDVEIVLQNDITINNYETLDTKFYDNDDGYPYSAFKGTFDGNGKKIIFNTQYRDYQFVSLFGRNEGVIKNLIIEKFNETGNIGNMNNEEHAGSRAAGICLYNDGTIQNCIVHADMNVNSFHDIAGICLINFENGIIENCGFDGKLNNTRVINWANNEYQHASGIACYNRGVIKNCINSGKITTSNGKYNNTVKNGLPGGIVSTVHNNSKIVNCYWLKENITRNNETKNYLFFHKKDNPQNYIISGCGYFDSFESGVTGCADYYENSLQTQTLSYTEATNVIDKLNAYVNDTENSGKELKQWNVDANGKLAFIE